MLFNCSWKYISLLHFGSLYYSSAIDYSWVFGSYMILPTVNALTAPCFELLLSLCWGISFHCGCNWQKHWSTTGQDCSAHFQCMYLSWDNFSVSYKRDRSGTPHFVGETTCKGTCGKSASEAQTASDVELANLLPSRKWRQRKVSVLGLLSTFLFFQMLCFASL